MEHACVCTHWLTCACVHARVRELTARLAGVACLLAMTRPPAWLCVLQERMQSQLEQMEVLVEQQRFTGACGLGLPLVRSTIPPRVVLGAGVGLSSG